jgi:endoglucanase
LAHSLDVLAPNDIIFNEIMTSIAPSEVRRVWKSAEADSRSGHSFRKLKSETWSGWLAGWRWTLFLVLLLTFAIPVVRAAMDPNNPFRGKRMYVDPSSPAMKQANAWQRSRPADAERMRRIAQQPQAIWLGEWMRDIRRESDAIMTTVSAAHALPVFVAYNIPHRDCGMYSAGGAGNGDDYKRWVTALARGLNGREAVVILEPDAIASIDCLPLRLKDERYVLLQNAVHTLTMSHAYVYIDAGNANWQQLGEMASRLTKAGIGEAQGFALNVSNFHSTQVNITYGDKLSKMIGGRHYVIDTSRNGVGAAVEKEWCNARNQALGALPSTNTASPFADAYLWVKTPGQSDGRCNGGPDAGTWWADYALELSRMAVVLSKAIAH